MIKEDRVKLARKMLRALAVEQEHRDGFNEFAQFSENGLDYLLEELSEKGLRILIERIEDASRKGISRRSKGVLAYVDDERGAW